MLRALGSARIGFNEDLLHIASGLSKGDIIQRGMKFRELRLVSRFGGCCKPPIQVEYPKIK